MAASPKFKRQLSVLIKRIA